MENEEVKLSKIEKMKKHVKDNKKVYIGTISGVVIGAFGAMLLFARKQKNINADLVQDFNQVACYKPVTVSNTYYQRISKYGLPLGRRGNPVREFDPNTGRTLHEFANQALAARDAGVSNCSMSKHLDGKYRNLNGREFERMDLSWLGEEIEGWDWNDIPSGQWADY
jgi:hypothetical protein